MRFSLRPTASAAALLAAALAVVLCASAARADTAQVTVVSPGGAQRALALEALAGGEDVVGRTHVLRSAAGEAPVTVTGFSLAALIDAAGADPYAFSYLEVRRPDGGAVTLSREQALAGGEAAPVIYATPTGTGFLRPASGPEDLNASDAFEAPRGIGVELRKGKAIAVEAEASAVRVEPGEKVEFRAIVERAGSGERLEFSWYFDDGHEASGESARHSFARPGSYDVVVGVTSGGDEAGASAVVTVQVGEPADGPNRKGGGDNERAGAPDHGAADGPATGSGKGAGAGATPPAPAATPAPAPAPTPAPERAPEPREARKQQAKPAPEQPAGEVVSGELLSAEAGAVRPEAEEEPERRAAARRGKLDQGDGGGVPGAAWGLLATFGLLGLGALGEVRGGTFGGRR